MIAVPAPGPRSVAFARETVDLLRALVAHTVMYDRSRAALSAWCMPAGWSCGHLMPAGHCNAYTAWVIANALGLSLTVYRSRR